MHRRYSGLLRSRAGATDCDHSGQDRRPDKLPRTRSFASGCVALCTPPCGRHPRGPLNRATAPDAGPDPGTELPPPVMRSRNAVVPTRSTCGRDLNRVTNMIEACAGRLPRLDSVRLPCHLAKVKTVDDAYGQQDFRSRRFLHWQDLQAPVKSGTLGPEVVDISALTKEHGVFTFDPGFMATASTESKITYIDGDEGVLLYRGYPVEQLAEAEQFPGSGLPADQRPAAEQATQLAEFVHATSSTAHDDQRIAAAVLQRVPVQRAPDGDVVRVIVASMAAFYHDSMDINNPRHREIFAHQDHRKDPDHRGRRVQAFDSASRSCIRATTIDYCSKPAEHVLFGTLRERTRLIRSPPRHSTCCSFSMRIMSRMRVPRPYGWREARARTLTPQFPRAFRPCGGLLTVAPMRRYSSHARADRNGRRTFPSTLRKAKDKNEQRSSLMGFGHRVYKNRDPRATIIRAMCHQASSRSLASHGQPVVRVGPAP